MKLVNYEKKNVLIFLIILMFIFLSLLIFYTFSIKINSYVLITGRVRKNNLVELLVNDDELNILYKNRFVYVSDLKKKFFISDVSKNILVEKDIKYSLVLIEVDLSLKDGDIVEVSFKDKRIRLWEIFKVIWKGEDNGKS